VVQVVRCFEDENIVHVEGKVDPLRDIETIQIELALADLATVERRREKAQKSLKSGDKVARQELDVLDKIQPALEAGRSARTVTLSDDDRAVARNFFLLTTKPTIYAANVDESALTDIDNNPMVQAVRDVAVKEAAECVVICAQLEADLVALPPEERVDYLKSLNVSTSGVDQLIKSAYHLLGLMSFLTAGEKEVRAWTIPQGTRAQTAAGTIHSDIERGFIRAEIVSYDELMSAGSYATAREKGLLRLEGKDYIMQEGDVVHFRFNV
jgi:GTP-binding protein YchF